MLVALSPASFLLLSLSHDRDWLSSIDSSSDSYEVRPEQVSWEVACNAGEAGSSPWVLLDLLKKPGERCQCGWVLAWGRGSVVKVKPLLLCINAVLPCLCGPGVASSPPLCSRIFKLVSCLWIVANWSCEGGLKWGTTYVALLMI